MASDIVKQKNNTPQKKPGRPKINIDWEEAEHLMEMGLCGRSIAYWFHIDAETFYRKVQERYNMGFTEVASRRGYRGRAHIQLRQYRKAIGHSSEGDTSMLIHLGKSKCGQTYQQNIDMTATQTVIIPQQYKKIEVND